MLNAVQNQPTNPEKWLPIVGYEGFYEVSDHGRVRTVSRITYRDNRWGSNSPMRVQGRILKGWVHQGSTGYLAVSLHRQNERKRNVFVHVLVLEAFVEVRPAGMVACHFNDEPTDNRLENLRWDTRAANAEDAARNGKNAMAAKTHCPRGHEYDRKYGNKRECSRCAREHQRRYLEKNPKPTAPRAIGQFALF